MTDLRTSAKAVIDTWDEHGVLACIVHIEALRQALDAPVEPVAWQYRVVFRLTGEDSLRHGRWHECRDKDEYDDYKSRHWFEVRELYAKPPSEPVEPVGYVISDPDGFVPVGYTKPPSEPVEPVAEIVRNETGQIRLVDSNGDSFDVSKHIGTKLYTTPPSVDALIAEAVATEREACAKLCEDRWQYGNAVDCSQAIRARGKK